MSTVRPVSGHSVDTVGGGRLRAVCDLTVPAMREDAGLHEYDGVVQDLSPAGVGGALQRLGEGDRAEDPHDERHLRLAEAQLRWSFGRFEIHRRNPYPHLRNLDLACYDRRYAPAGERRAARRSHLAHWPEAVEAAIEALDAVPAPVAAALLPSAQGLAEHLPRGSTDPVVEAARTAHTRFVDHLRRLSADGSPEVAIGGSALAGVLGVGEGVAVDLTELAATAEGERDRLRAMLDDACGRLDPARTAAELVPDLRSDHPDAAGVIGEAEELTREVLTFTRERRLAPWTDGDCLVGPSPRSRRWALAMLAGSAPEEPDAPSWYHISPPEPGWPPEDVEEWLSVFSRTSLPAITVHEVAPGHFAHARALRRVASPVARLLHSSTFSEGWAHYVEEVAAEEGFRGEDPRYLAGMCLEALTRVTRLRCSIGLHTGSLDVGEAAAMFRAEAFLGAAAARSEARRGTFDYGYGRYTLGKLEIMKVREQARKAWGGGFSLERFHRALLGLGSPPVGLLGTAIAVG